MTDSREAIERRTEDAFARSGWQDPRAPYRALLRRLREIDAAAFEAALAEYDARVVQRLGDEGADAIAAWLDYGARLAELIGGGRIVEIDPDGRSLAVERVDPARPTLLLHLPADESAAAIVVALPREASAAQLAAVALLADRRQALTA